MTYGSPLIPFSDIGYVDALQQFGSGQPMAATPVSPPNPFYNNPAALADFQSTPAWMPEWMKGAIGTKEAPGWGGMAIGGASAIMNGIMGMKQYGLAKQALAENKRQFQLNYDAQRSTTNTALEDRQRARVASNPGAYQSVGDYMNQHGVK